ncbi:MAG TPA: pyridoxal phosphate-dependent aminotransferase [Candidatus Hydrogenedens sp.]|nr:pyridoxal phosphate-dependent aminotransferase [Candidatus Hydrogenedens sp.]
MFLSKRFSNYELSGEVNRLAKLYKEYVSTHKELFDLTISNPTHANIIYPAEEILSTFNNNKCLSYDPIPKGLYSARKAISDYYFSQGFSVSPDDIFLTSGTSESYSYLIKLLCNPRDEILIPAPSYPLLDFIATLESVEVIPYYLVETGNRWHFSIEQIINQIGKRTKVLLFIQPNNPTGNILSTGEIEALISVAENYNLAIIIDEVFRDYLFSNKTPQLLNSPKIPIFTLNGISKTLALPQMKLGWIICSCPDAIKREMYEALEIIADTYLSVNTPVQIALPDLFNYKDIIQQEVQTRILHNLEFAKNKISDSSVLTPYIPEGGWYLVLKINDNSLDEEEVVCNLLMKTGVYVHPGSMFRFPEGNHLILSLLAEEKIFQEGFNKIVQFFN